LKNAENLWERENWTAKKTWPAIIDAIQKLNLKSGDLVHGISVTSMREEFILVDNERNEIQYTLTNESMRYGEKILAEYGKTMYDSSGHWPIPNWIAGAVLPWLMNSRPNLMDKTAQILMISDWVNYKLTGHAYTEGTGACETSLYDVRKNTFNWEIIDTLELPPSIFPQVLSNSTMVGEATDKITKKLGLMKGIPVFMGGADTQNGLIGLNTKVGEISAVGGTTTPIQIVTSAPVFDRKRRTWTNNHLLKDRWTLESNAGYTGGAVRWAFNEYGFKDYKSLEQEAKKIAPGSNGVLCYLGSYLFKAGPPYWETDRLGDLPVKRTIVGDANRATIVRAIIESNCYAVKANLDQLCEITGNNVNELKFCGGNTKSSLWMQIQADVLGIPVKVPVVRDGTAVGAAVLSAVGLGYYSSHEKAAEKMVRFSEYFQPNQSHHESYTHYYQNWMNTRLMQVK
jgi:autoinducer 2 (AI-2) kinase